METIFDLAILGGGPAGAAAGIYAARKKMKTLLITKNFQGQSVVSDNIQNWVGEISISGDELHKKLEAHLKYYKGEFLDIKEAEMVTKVEKLDDLFSITTNKGSYQAKTVLITSGRARKKLSIPGADTYENKGITYCATCDGPMFGGMDVAVLGGGNSALESAAQLSAYAKSVTLIQRSGEFRADKITIDRVLSIPNVKAYTNTELIEVKGDKFVSALVFKKTDTGEVIDLPVQGIFVEIGATPSTEFIRHGLVELDKQDSIVIDPWTQKTSTPGIWAAGDCTTGLYKQNNIAVGDAIKAIEDIYKFLKA